MKYELIYWCLNLYLKVWYKSKKAVGLWIEWHYTTRGLVNGYIITCPDRLVIMYSATNLPHCGMPFRSQAHALTCYIVITMWQYSGVRNEILDGLPLIIHYMQFIADFHSQLNHIWQIICCESPPQNFFSWQAKLYSTSIQPQQSINYKHKFHALSVYKYRAKEEIAF